MNRYSFSSRIALMLGIAVTLIMGAAAVAMDNLIDAEMTQRFDASLVAQANAVTALVEIDGGQVDLKDLRQTPSRLLIGQPGAAYTVQCSGQPTLQSHPAPPVNPAHWIQRATNQPAFADIDAPGGALRAVWFRFAPQGEAAGGASRTGAATSCALLWMQPRRPVDDILATVDTILWIIPLLALVSVFLVTPAVVRRGLRPLAMLGERMRSIGPAAPEERLPSGETHELVPLVTRFNEVLERMQEGMKRERRFAGALAHETRTRLAELRTLVDIEQRYPGERSMIDVLGEVGAIGSELEDTVTGLLLLTRLEAGIESLRRQQVDLHALVDKQVGQVSGLATERGIDLRVQAPATNVCLIGDAAVLGIVIGNLLRNAVAYAPPRTVVELSWDVSALRLVNAAPDLTAEDVSQFGQRYWRKHIEVSDGAHAGLGLSLAAAAATALELGLRFELDARQRLVAILGWPPERRVDNA